MQMYVATPRGEASMPENCRKSKPWLLSEAVLWCSRLQNLMQTAIVRWRLPPAFSTIWQWEHSSQVARNHQRGGF